MPKKIYFPPKKGGGSFVLPLFLTYGEELSVEFSTPGYFSHSDNSALTPDLPTGNIQTSLAPVCLGHYTAAHRDHTFTISYLTGNSIYSQVVEIRRTIPPTIHTDEE